MTTATATFALLATALFGATAIAAGGPDGLLPLTLRCEYLVNPIGVDEPKPRLSWTLSADTRGAKQTAYQIVVATKPDLLEPGKADVWDSGRVQSAEQNQIEYAGKPLTSRQACVWRVRTWDEAGRPGPWSDAATWEVGLAKPTDWHAKWVYDGPADAPARLTIQQAVYESVDGKKSRDVTDLLRQRVLNGALDVRADNGTLGGDPAFNSYKQLRVRFTTGDKGDSEEKVYREASRVQLPLRAPRVMRQTFDVTKPVARARLYATALGIYDCQVNGRPVTDTVFNPIWTDFAERVRYQAYDVTDLVRSGKNALSATVSHGFYSGHIGNGGYQVYGKRPALFAQLEVTYADGTVVRVATDENWKSHEGPVRSADVMNGEDYDARLAQNFSDPDLADDGAWTAAEVKADGLPKQINPQVAEPVRELTTLTARSVNEPIPGHYLFDLGQNMVGVERLKLNAPAGTRVTVRFAEMLNPDGTAYTVNYRGAASTDTYVCRGGGETWQPTLTYHGFRYVELTGLPTKPDIDAVVGVVQGSATPQSGTFACSDSRINQLWSNILWGQRGNFFGVPTDCPQRDERLGWMGDAQVFIGTAVYNADVAAFFSKWLVDVDDAQRPDGAFTDTVPAYPRPQGGSPAWGDAGVICPWTIYQTYGDKRQLARHLPAMKKWVDFCRERSTDLIRDKDRGSDFGDWLSIGADTPKDLLGTAYFAHVADLVSRSGRALGDEKTATEYGELFRQIKAAFAKKYVAADGSITGGTQTAYALALTFDLLPEADRAAAARRLADDVRAKGDHLSTGFVGVSYLLPSLANNGQEATAHTLLMQDTFPSWLFSIKHGATTIWERWDGWTPDKGFQDAGMNSFNHYSLGSCGQWLYEAVAGIAQTPGGSGFERLDIRPRVGGGLTHAAASYDSVRGKIATDWTTADGHITLGVTVPPNVTAVVHMPTSDTSKIEESGKPADKAEGVKPLGNGAFEIGSGTYRFTGPYATESK